MSHIPETGLPFVLEDEATGDTARLYDDIKRSAHLPDTPNIVSALGASPPALNMFSDIWGTGQRHSTLPHTLYLMIQYVISEKRQCIYCRANYEVSCRMLGIDESTLADLVTDIDSVEPIRTRAIIRFATKIATEPQELRLEDYDAVREHGVSDEEIMEIIMISAASVACNIVAEALKLEIEDKVANILESRL